MYTKFFYLQVYDDKSLHFIIKLRDLFHCDMPASHVNKICGLHCRATYCTQIVVTPKCSACAFLLYYFS